MISPVHCVCRLRSASHDAHGPQHSVERPEVLALLRTHVRAKTMGTQRPRGAAHTDAQKTATQVTNRQGVQATRLAPGLVSSTGAGVDESTVPCGHAPDLGRSTRGRGGGCSGGSAGSKDIDTLRSRVPLKWAASSATVGGSSYAAAFARAAARSPQMPKALPPTASPTLGAVDRHVHPSRNGPLPVELRWLQVRSTLAMLDRVQLHQTPHQCICTPVHVLTMAAWHRPLLVALPPPGSLGVSLLRMGSVLARFVPRNAKHLQPLGVCT